MYGYQLISTKIKENRSALIYISSQNKFKTEKKANRYRIKDARDKECIINILTKKIDHNPYIFIKFLDCFFIKPIVKTVIEYLNYKPIYLEKIICGFMDSSCLFCQDSNCTNGVVGYIPELLRFPQILYPRFICHTCYSNINNYMSPIYNFDK